MNILRSGHPRGPRRTTVRLSLLATTIALALGAQAQEAPVAEAPEADGQEGEVSFDASFFPSGMAPRVDLARFGREGYVPAGTYRGDIIVNGQWQGTSDIVYADVDGQSQLCLSAERLQVLGVDLTRLHDDAGNQPAQVLPDGDFCGDIAQYIPGASTEFDAGSQVLRISVPQIYMAADARGYVDPSQWQSGINAFSLGYTSNVYRASRGGDVRYSAYAGVNATLRMGNWQAIHRGALSLGDGAQSGYRSNMAYLQHDIVPLQAQLVIGDTDTNGETFDSVRLRGVRLASDDRMLPQSQRGFAPIIRGTAESNARVVVRQRGVIVHEISVAPGPFAIDDLYATGYGGDLDVEVQEADGRSRTFVVPFSAVPQLLRPGQDRWSINAGRINEINQQNAPLLLQGSYQRGLSNTLTAYAGTSVGEDYRAGLLGAAVNTAAGAFAADVTVARTTVAGTDALQGNSLRLSYSKNIAETGTNIAMAAHRYSTSGYVSLRDWASRRDAVARGLDSDAVMRQRTRMDISLNQRLGERGGQLYVVGSSRDFWNSPGRQVDLSAGYSNQWRTLSYSLSFQRTRDSLDWRQPGLPGLPGQADLQPAARDTRVDNRLFLTLSMPLGKASRAPLASLMQTRSGRAATSTQLNISGVAPGDDRFNYNAALSHAADTTTSNLSGQYRGARAQVGANVTQGNGYTQMGLGASGGLVVHDGGITLAPALGDTMALVHADGAAGARVENGNGAVLNKSGFAVVPYLQPYERNAVTLDPKGTDIGVEMQETAQFVAPRAGTLVRLEFPTKRANALMIDATTPDGTPLPFGADVVDAKGNSVGVVGQGSRVLVNDLQQSGTVNVQWGASQAEQCALDVVLPAIAGRTDYQIVQGTCRPLAAQSAATAAVAGLGAP